MQPSVEEGPSNLKIKKRALLVKKKKTMIHKKKSEWLEMACLAMRKNCMPVTLPGYTIKNNTASIPYNLSVPMQSASHQLVEMLGPTVY